MEPSTTINKMLLGNKIFVPNYQRAYSWETPTQENDKNSKTHTDVFYQDLLDCYKSYPNTHYYFGHFLFEEKGNNLFGVIDGQQRLTTIIIFLSALYSKLKSLRPLEKPLEEDEEVYYENMIKRRSQYIFSTVNYDNQLFKDYVIDQTKKDKNSLETESAKRIVKAFDYFTNQLSDKDEEFLTKMLKIVSEARCTTHIVNNESEAIQMFIFQNNRGKKPSNLEIIKAQFMFNVHLYGGEEKESLIEELKNRFEKIYKSISSIEYKIDEDDILIYTLRVYFNSLWETDAIDKINKLLSESNRIQFIKSFTDSLAKSFEVLTTFFGKDEIDNIEIHSLVTLGGFTIAIPFIIKAYSFGLPITDICTICSSFEKLVLRHRLIGTRAELITRINDVFQKFTKEQKDIQPIIERIEHIRDVKNEEWWWAYWNNSELEKSIQGSIHHSTAKFILWKYENFLINENSLIKKKENGYSSVRFDSIDFPELEHIAPQIQTKDERVATGYNEYDDEFKNQYINCLGNYLLISKKHNCSIGNKPFKEKISTYTHLFQQREIQKMAKESEIWNKEQIRKRKEKIMRFVLENF